MSQQINHDSEGLGRKAPQFNILAENWGALTERLAVGAQTINNLTVGEVNDDLSRNVVKTCSEMMDNFSQIVDSLNTELDAVGLRVGGVKSVRDAAGEQAEDAASSFGGKH